MRLSAVGDLRVGKPLSSLPHHGGSFLSLIARGSAIRAGTDERVHMQLRLLAAVSDADAIRAEHMVLEGEGTQGSMPEGVVRRVGMCLSVLARIMPISRRAGERGDRDDVLVRGGDCLSRR